MIRAWHHISTPVAFAIALVVGLIAFGAFARAEFPVGPARVSVAAVPALGGRTTLTAPPFGSVSARTHAAPLRLEASLREVDLPSLQRFAARGLPSDDTVADIRSRVVQGGWSAMARGLLAAALASAFVGWSLRHRLWVLVASTGLGVAVPAALVAWTALSFSPVAFQAHPTYEGALAYAPSLVQLVQERAQTVESARSRVAQFTRELSAYYASPQSFSGGGSMDGTFRVLDVSDTHMDPVGQQLARDLAKRFDVGLVIDTGDAINYGSDVEANLAARSIVESVPVVFVPGNHDSPAVVAAMRRAGATVLASSEATVAGLRIYGVADPMSVNSEFEPNYAAATQAGELAAEDIRRRLASGDTTPDIIAAHEVESAEPLLGIAPLALVGHTHTPELTERNGTRILNPGTTGGVHFTKLRSDPHIPHGAAILYYTSSLPRRLIAIDQIEVDGVSDRFTLSRTMVDASLLPKAQGEPTSASSNR